MPSRFGWVDFSEEDREKMLDVIQMFREQDTVDELGIGTIRDAFANHFFPGTSTIQTRARYMLFIPWMYLSLEKKKVSSARIVRRARQEEVRLIYALLETDDTDGVIGKQAKKKLQRLPSNIYWSGLKSWGIRLFPRSQPQYHRFMDVYASRVKHTLYNDDSEPAGTPLRLNWDPGIPKPPDGFPDGAKLALTREESEYLRDRILLRHEHCLLALLLRIGEIVQAPFLWHHPSALQAPESLRRDIRHARNFSESIHGAPLLYNLMLARMCKSDELIEIYETFLIEWRETLTSRWEDLTAWHDHLEEFWGSPALELARIPIPTRTFVKDWLDLVFRGSTPSVIANSADAKLLIRDREVRLKRHRARLENQSALDMWKGASSIQQLSYRWRIASRMIRDILLGLREEEVDDA